MGVDKPYKFEIGQIINLKYSSLLIVDRYIKYRNYNTYHKKAKFYKYKCLKCGYINEIIQEDLIKASTCPVCANKKVLKGINDIWTTNPALAKLLANPEDGYKYTEGSSQKVDWKCPSCGNIIKNKHIYSVKIQGICCPYCSDNISFPEKFMYNLLKQLDIDFEYQKKFDWCRYKLNGKQKYGLYDFYIPSKQLIIETDGSFHYKDNDLSGQTKEESNEIDNLKDRLAQNYGMQVVRINCDYKYNLRFDYVKNSIINSQLTKYFELTNVNWNFIYKESEKSVLIKACNLWNKSNNLKEIQDKLKLGRTVITKYLKVGTKLYLCNYDPKIEQQKSQNFNLAKIYKCKKVVCLTTNEIFDSITEAENKYGKYGSSNIGVCCKGKNYYSGKLPDGTKLKWMYLDKYLQNTKLDKDLSA